MSAILLRFHTEEKQREGCSQRVHHQLTDRHTQTDRLMEIRARVRTNQGPCFCFWPHEYFRIFSGAENHSERRSAVVLPQAAIFKQI